MATRRIRPAAWEFLHDASEPSLQNFELSRLNNAANLRREIAALLDQWIEDTSQALLAQWVRKERASPHLNESPDARPGDYTPLFGEVAEPLPVSRSARPARQLPPLSVAMPIAAPSAPPLVDLPAARVHLEAPLPAPLAASPSAPATEPRPAPPRRADRPMKLSRRPNRIYPAV